MLHLPRNLRRSLFFAVTISCAAIAQAASPSLTAIEPHGGQRGTELDVSLVGDRLGDAQEILFYYPGVKLVKIEKAEDKQLKCRLKIAADCRLGEHALRVRTASGISDLRAFYVGALPAVAEQEPNNELAAPQKIELNVTVNAIGDREDIDYYQVEAKQGQPLVVEIEGMRLGNAIFDPVVAIFDSEQAELITVDDTPLVWQDAVAALVAPKDGNYTIAVREASYTGSRTSAYRMHVGTFPRPLAAYPAGGMLGQELEVRFVGDVAGELTQKIKLPAVPDPRFGLFAETQRGISPSPVGFRLADVGNVLETEPNNIQKEATSAELPLAFNGVISTAGDTDYFRFKAAKGTVYDVQCYARRLRSPLDPVIAIEQVGGGTIGGNDDAAGADAIQRFTAPADGEYAIRVTDQLGRGGPEYVYRIEFVAPKPTLTLAVPKTGRYTQERQVATVPRGNRFALLVSATRSAFSGDLAVAAEGLPAGVTLSADTLPNSVNMIPVLFEAAADAPVAGTLSNLTARLVDPKQAIAGGLNQPIELLYGPPNQNLYWSHPIDRLAVAVAEESPYKLSIVEPKAPLVQNGSMELKIVAERNEGFTAPITLLMLFNPPGVGSASSVTIPEGKNEAVYPLNANRNAEARKWKIAVVGSANAGKGPVWVSTQLATLEVAQPFVAFTLERTAVEQGATTEISAKIQQNTPFEGKAKVKLVGLPAKVTTPELEITKDSTELAFAITTNAASPPGRHRNIFCQVTVMQNGEPVLHTTGVTELQIDRPLPKADVASAASPKPATGQPPEKRLTRLEKLRLEAAQAKAARTAPPAQP